MLRAEWVQVLEFDLWGEDVVWQCRMAGMHRRAVLSDAAADRPVEPELAKRLGDAAAVGVVSRRLVEQRCVLANPFAAVTVRSDPHARR